MKCRLAFHKCLRNVSERGDLKECIKKMKICAIDCTVSINARKVLFYFSSMLFRLFCSYKQDNEKLKHVCFIRILRIASTVHHYSFFFYLSG